VTSHLAPSQDVAVYDLDRASWDPAWVPDLENPPATIALSADQIIDIVILGDGYELLADFETALEAWLADFHAVEVYQRFRGAFRIRGIFTRSGHPASADRESYFRVKLDSSGGVSNDGWWNGSSARNREFRRRLFCVLDLLPLNWKRYPGSIDVGGTKTVIHNTLHRMYSNLVVCLLVRTAGGGTASGRTRDVDAPDDARLNVAFGATSIHEFGHAFAYLEDEYISRRRSKANRTDPAKPSLFTLSNISFRDRLDGALWAHLSPWGSAPRQGAEHDPSPIVGWLWRGGEQDLKVWHSEYQCLMNGAHENYAYTSDEASDPTANPGGGFTGAALRSPGRYCLWCQEIVAARILEKTGQLAESGDPANINARGRAWYESWVTRWRPRYWAFFGVTGQIVDREAFYAHGPNLPVLDAAGLALWRSDLYKPFEAGPAVSSSAPDVPDGEWLLLSG
jgi:hypothetical protein